VSKTEKDNIHLVEWHGVSEFQIGLTQQAFMNIRDFVACVRTAIDECDFYVWVVEQQADEFSACIARTTKYSYFNHILSF
jgi:hypothetical protein